MSAIVLRPATAADAAAICRIYNQGIEDRLATLETELRTPDERRAVAGRPWPAASGVRGQKRDEMVVGWSSLNVYNPRPAYRYVADFPSTSSADGGKEWAGGRSSTSSSRRGPSTTTR